MKMSIEQNIYQAIQKYMQVYCRMEKKKRNQFKVLSEIGGTGAERLKNDVQLRFDDELLEVQKRHGSSIRHYVSKIEDEAIKKQVRYLANMCIRHPEQYYQEPDAICEEIRKIFSPDTLTDTVNKPP